jgi:hypothetical protein
MANWHYYNENREKVGPITGKELKQLALMGTVTPEHFVEDPTGRTGLAKDVKGLTFAETPLPIPIEDIPLSSAHPPPVGANPFTIPIEQNPFTVPVPPVEASPFMPTDAPAEPMAFTAEEREQAEIDEDGLPPIWVYGFIGVYLTVSIIVFGFLHFYVVPSIADIASKTGLPQWFLIVVLIIGFIVVWMKGFVFFGCLIDDIRMGTFAESSTWSPYEWSALTTVKQRCSAIGGTLLVAGVILYFVSGNMYTHNQGLIEDYRLAESDRQWQAGHMAWERRMGVMLPNTDRYMEAMQESGARHRRLQTDSYSADLIGLLSMLSVLSFLCGCVLLVVGWVLPK